MKIYVCVVTMDREGQKFKNLIKSLEEYTVNEFELLVWDNGKENIGLSKALNKLVCAVPKDEDFVFRFDDDVEVTAGWDVALVRALGDKRVGVVGPLTDVASGFQGGHELSDVESKFFSYHYMIGMCMGFRKGSWCLVGGFDEGFGKVGGEDVAFGYEMILHGLACVVCCGSFVYHRRDVFKSEELIGEYRFGNRRLLDLYSDKVKSGVIKSVRL